jgi:aldose sugar dehydrogenase
MTITEGKYQNKLVIIVLSIIIVSGITAVVFFFHLDNTIIINRGPFLKSPYNKSLRVEVVAEGLSSPTSMAFLGGNNKNNNILILEKARGTVRLVSNGSLKEEPILTVNVDAKGERGLLGVATKIQHNSNKVGSGNDIADIFLYYTQADPLRNRIYQYQWKNGNIKLVNPKLILDLPAEPGPYHQGGKLKLSQDNKFLYAVIGDLNSPDTKLQNHKYGKEPNDTSVILKINVDNISSRTTNIANTMQSASMQSNKYSSYYYAYGIRNSFGLAVDPITGSIWDTENGEHTYDELNLVKPGFNSGWSQIMGPVDRNNNESQKDLVNFEGSKYADPVFSWRYEIGITDIEFLNSSKLGQKYTNNIFVGDINYGNLYYFEMNDTRTGIKLNPTTTPDGLSDLVADDSRESSSITFGVNFGRITDIETGPDGFLYILSYDEGKLYRILPS